MLDLIFYSNAAELERIRARALELGTTKLLLAKNFSLNELKQLKKDLVGEKKVKHYFCHVLEKDDSRELKRFLGSVDFLAVQGKNMKLNKFAVSQKKVDFLLQPFAWKKMEFDTAIARLAHDNDVKIVFLFNEFSERQGFQKSLVLKNAFLCVKLLKKFKAKALFFSGAKNAFQLRSPKDLQSLAVLLGFTLEQAKRFTEKMPEQMLKEKLERKK